MSRTPQANQKAARTIVVLFALLGIGPIACQRGSPGRTAAQIELTASHLCVADGGLVTLQNGLLPAEELDGHRFAVPSEATVLVRADASYALLLQTIRATGTVGAKNIRITCKEGGRGILAHAGQSPSMRKCVEGGDCTGAQLVIAVSAGRFHVHNSASRIRDDSGSPIDLSMDGGLELQALRTVLASASPLRSQGLELVLALDERTTAMKDMCELLHVIEPFFSEVVLARL